MNRLRLAKQIAHGMLTALLLAACTGDEPTTNVPSGGTPLPEGKYPLAFTATQSHATPQTRVTETPDGTESTWTDGDQISVCIGANPQIGKYTLNADGSIAKTLTPIYWQNTTEATVYGWYSTATAATETPAEIPATTTETVDLSNQRSGLKYILKGTGKGSYSSAPTLTFTHQLAKVRAKLTYPFDFGKTTIGVLGDGACTHIQGGEVTGTGQETYISMHPVTHNGTLYYEANMVPGTLAAANAFQLIIDGKSTEITLSSAVTLVAGKVHNITLNVDQPPGEIDLSTITGNSLDVVEDVILNGHSTVSQSLDITIWGDVKVTLKNVILVNSTIYCKGSPTITLSGTNAMSGDHTFFDIEKGNNTLTIKGTDNDKLTLTPGRGSSCFYGENANIIINGGCITADATNGSGAGIGSSSGGKAFGNITINGGIITAIGGHASAGIGGARNASCGKITITGGTIVATGGWDAPGIGSGASGSSYGDISITGGTITATGTRNSQHDIGVGQYGTGGKVTVSDGLTIKTNSGSIAQINK